MTDSLHQFIDFASGATLHVSWASVLATMTILIVAVSAMVRRL